MTVIRAIGDVSISRPLDEGPGQLLSHGAPDLVIGNLEIPLTDLGWPAEKVSVSRAAPELVSQYAALGADVWSLATNHALDWGIPGLQHTMRGLDDAGMCWTGAGNTLDEATAPARTRARDGSIVAVLNVCCTLPMGSAATARRPGIAPLRIEQSFEFDAARMEEQPGSPPRMITRAREDDLARGVQAVREAAAWADIVVVSIHWGVAWPFLPPNQGPLADYQQPVGRALIDAGAHVVIGTHPHALHPVEFYRDGIILYSLGNFLFHEEPSLPPEERRRTAPLHPILRSGPWFEGAVFDVEIASGAVSALRLTALRLDQDGNPALAAESEIDDVLRPVLTSPEVTVTADGPRRVVTR